jgi:hypothetical protein
MSLDFSTDTVLPAANITVGSNQPLNRDKYQESSWAERVATA